MVSIWQSKPMRISEAYLAATTNGSFLRLSDVLTVLGPHPPGGTRLILRTRICTAAESDCVNSKKCTPGHLAWAF